MKTQTELEAMSDFELEKILALLQKKNVKGGVYYPHPLNINYCSNPNDIMPLAFKHKIDLFWGYDSKLWNASARKDISIIAKHNNPLRAAVIVLILLLQESKDND